MRRWCTQQLPKTGVVHRRPNSPRLLSKPSSIRFLIRHPSSIRSFSWDGHGTDLLSESLAHNYGVPKVILHGHSSTGFDVVNLIKNMDPTDSQVQQSRGIVHMAGSILAFPGAAFMWNVRSPDELTLETLAPTQLYRPKLEYLFLGSAQAIHPSVVEKLRQGMAEENSNIVIEPMDLVRTGICI